MKWSVNFVGAFVELGGHRGPNCRCVCFRDDSRKENVAFFSFEFMRVGRMVHVVFCLIS